MKYLKLFESLNYYEKISCSDFYNKFFLPEEEVNVMTHPVIKIASAAGHFNYDSIENFSKIEVSKIDEALSYTPFEVKKLNIQGLHHVGPANINKERDNILHNGILQLTKSKLRPSKRDPYRNEWRDVVFFEIFKCTDDWFYIYQYGMGEQFYRCDQLDGLIKFLEEIVIPKRNESLDLGFLNVKPGDLGSKFRNDKSSYIKQKDIDKIKSILKPYGLKDSDYYNNDDDSSSLGFWMPYKDIKSTRKYIRIESFKDEWFLLTDYPHYYECDQIEGVISCLKTLLPIDYVTEEYYKEITREKYAEHLKSGNIFCCFTKNESKLIESVFDGLGRIEFTKINALLETSYDSFLISDKFNTKKGIELNKLIDIDYNEVIIHHSDGSIKKYQSSSGKDDVLLDELEDFCIMIESTGMWDKISKKTYINKIKDEWYLIEHGGLGKKFYLCDQIDSVIKFLKDIYGNWKKDMYVKTYENKKQEYYTSLSNREYFNLLRGDKIHCFTENEISKINDFVEVHSFPANIESSYGDFTIYDQFDLCESVGSDTIEVTYSNGKKKVFHAYYVEEESVHITDLPNFTLAILKTDEEMKTSKNSSMKQKAYINKIEDEWYIVELRDVASKIGETTKFYKCDQIEGLLELLKTFNKPLKESYHSKETFEDVKDAFEIRVVDRLELEYCEGNIYREKIKKFGIYEYDITESISGNQRLDILVRINEDYDITISFHYYIDDVFRKSIQKYGYDIINFESPLRDDFYIIQIEKISSLNESFHKEGYYEEIDDVEYDEMLWMNDSDPDEDGQQDDYYKSEKPNIEDFTQKEIEILSRGKKYEIYGPGSDFPSWGIPQKSIIVDDIIIITKLKDEWFLVRDTNNWMFKCDQIDGVLSCLEKLDEYYD
jgi:hypothetical protein